MENEIEQNKVNEKLDYKNSNPRLSLSPAVLKKLYNKIIYQEFVKISHSSEYYKARKQTLGKTECGCGSIYFKTDAAIHFKTAKHQRHLISGEVESIKRKSIKNHDVEWNTKTVCECGCVYAKSNRFNHLRGVAHTRFLETGHSKTPLSNIKINCECGGVYLKSNKFNHLLSKKHQKNVEITERVQETL